MSTAAGQHLRQDLTREQHGRYDVQLDHAADDLGVLALEAHYLLEAGVVDQNIDLAPYGPDALRQVVALFGFGEVHSHDRGLALNFRGHILK